MNRKLTTFSIFCMASVFAFALPAGAFEPQSEAFSAATALRAPIAALWTDRGSMESLDLLNGPGGKDHAPTGKFTFVKEDKNGTSPKFDVVDDQGVHWKAKLGEETRSETAATRLVWAAGYFADEDYYLPALHVDKMPKLARGSEFVGADGMVRGVRLERKLPHEKKNGTWSWFKNPFMGTKEMDGLRIMMALLNNWDLKEINNSIYLEKGAGNRYVVSDLGASLGETGNVITRSKSNANDYIGSKFVQKVSKDHVDFILSSRPFVLSAVDVPNYLSRTKMQDVVKDIPIEHARWLGKLLDPLSDEQIRDCFRAAGYTPEEVEGYAGVVRERIKTLSAL